MNESSTPSDASSHSFPVRTWLIAFTGWMFDFYDLILFSFLLIPLGEDFHLSESQEAWLLGCALGASGAGGIIFGYLSDVYGRKRTMMWTICLYSLGTALTAFSTGPWMLCLFRLITGLGIGGEWAVGHALLAEAVPRNFRGRASAFLQIGEPVGVALAAAVGLLLTPHVGWRWVCLLSSMSASIAIAVRFYMPESALWESQRSERLSPVAAIKQIGDFRLWGVAFKGWVLGTLKLGTYWTCYIWLPKFLQREMDQSIGYSVMWILTAQVGQLIGMLTFGVVADRLGRRWAFTMYSLLTAAALYPLAFHWRTLVAHPGLLWTTLFSLGLGSGCTAGFGALLAELFPTQIRNFAMGAVYNSARGVQFLAPIIVGYFVKSYGLAGGLSVPLVLAVVTATWVWTLPETHHRELAAIEPGMD